MGRSMVSDGSAAAVAGLSRGYVTLVDPTSENGMYIFARIADELGRVRPDIPFLVAEKQGAEADLAACGLDLRVHGNVHLIPMPVDLRALWSVTRVQIRPSLGPEADVGVVAASLSEGIPVVGADRDPLPEVLGEAGIVVPVPARMSTASRWLPTPQDVAPWLEAIVRIWDDTAWYEQCRARALVRGRQLASASAVAPVGLPAARTVRPTPGAEPSPRPSIEAGLEVIRRRWPDLRNDCEDDPVFVLSAGWRSGSTLLQRLIVHRCFLWGEPFGHAGLIESLADPLRSFTSRWPEAHHFHKGADAETLSRTFIANLYPSISNLLGAHHAFFERLFAEPARRAGAARWGFKEVRLEVDHALYLKWLYPRARFLFLIRNPYDAWRSYAARAARGWKWFKRWPDEPVTVHSFADHWHRLTTSFLSDHAKVGGLVVRYEALKAGDYTAMESYLGFSLSRQAGRINPSDGGPPPLGELPQSDRQALDDRLGALTRSLGYDDRTAAAGTHPPGRETRSSQGEPRPAPAPPVVGATVSGRKTDLAGCVVLVPVGHHVEPACDDALRELERQGYTVRRVRGYSAIDQGRNQLATDALRDGFNEIMWIDSDVAFDPAAVARLRSHGLPITCGLYPKKGRRAFASNFPDGTKQVLFGKIGGLVEVPYAAAGFLHTRREVYESIQERFQLPACNERFGPSMVPFFQPLVIPDGSGHWYLAEDFSFCHRVRECGYRILADTTIRLMHIGAYPYSWEDAGGERPRFGSYTFHVVE